MSEAVGNVWRVRTAQPSEVANRDEWLVAVAMAQAGVVSLPQLRVIGFSKQEIATLIARKRLHRYHRGVYVLGTPRINQMGRVWAAHLATGATPSHRAASFVHDVLSLGRGPIHLITPTEARSRKKLILHRCYLDPAERTEVDGLPVTTLARTLLDLAATSEDVATALNNAQIAQVYDHAETTRLANAGRPGSQGLRTAIENLEVPVVLRSELERRFLAFILKARLPHPQVNTRLHGYEVDFFWPHAALIVEVDGVRYHETARAKERDPVKDNALTLAGLRVLRYRWRRVTRRGAEVAAELGRALGE